MQIGELATLTSTQVVTIRYYEREGLLPKPARSDGNYRVYDKSHIERLSFIRRCRTLDMDLDEIRTLLRFKDTPEDDCANVNGLLDEHIDHVSERIKELRKLEKELKELRSMCGESQSGDGCGIIRGLSAGKTSVAGPASHVGQVHGVHTKAKK